MEPKHWVAVGLTFVALNLVYAGTVVLSYARYRDAEEAAAIAVGLADSPIGYLVLVALLLTAGYAVDKHRRGELV